jgi:hypothetical protein
MMLRSASRGPAPTAVRASQPFELGPDPRPLLATILLMVLSAAPVRADDPWLPSPAARRTPPPDRPLWVAAGLTSAVTVFDVESTYAVLDRCPRCAEGNVFLSGVVDSGRGWTYGLQTGITAGVTSAAYRMRRSSHRGVRRAWWVPLAVVSFAHVTGGLLNVTHEGDRPRAR